MILLYNSIWYKITASELTKIYFLKWIIFHVIVCDTFFSSIYSLGIEKGIVDISSSTLKIYHPVGADGKDDMEEASSALASTIKVIFATNEYVYFAMSSSVYRADLFTTSGSFNSKAYAMN